MNHFGLSRSRNCDKNNLAKLPSSLELKCDAPALIEGADVLDAVCPVSSLTGNRMSIYEAMQMVGNEKYSRAIDALLPELPTIMSDSRLTDDDRVDLLVSRLATGSTSEDSRMREQLSKIVSDFKDTVDAAVTEKSVAADVVDTSHVNVDGNE